MSKKKSKFFSVTVRRMKLKFGILALDIALYNRTLRFLFRSDKNSDYEDMEEGFAIDLCSKKVLESCAVTHSCLDFFFTCIHEKAGFLFSNKSCTHMLVALNVIYHMM